MKLTKGDSILFTCTINGIENLDNWKIRCEIYDDYQHSIKLATANSGGSDEQIKITDSENCKFEIYVPKDATADFDDIAYIEIEVESPDGQVQTLNIRELPDGRFELKDQKITWTTPS